MACYFEVKKSSAPLRPW